jgi:carboxylesterase type B
VLQSIKQNQAFIAVFLNYRLNIFGFGASSDMIAAQSRFSSLKGINFGLRDQKVALTWISKNIAAFGGDPEKTTIAGQSCGASSVHAHLLEAELGDSGNSKALFQKAILQSGALGCAGPRPMADADRHWSDLCRKFRIEHEEPVRRVELLKRVPADRLLSAATDLRWSTYPLYVDGITLKPTNLGCEVLVELGDVASGCDSEDLDAKERREIEIVAGDVDSEVGTPYLNPIRHSKKPCAISVR